MTVEFTVRTHEEIRAELLDDWRERYLERGYDLDTEEGSDAWCWADAVAFQLEGLEARALQLTKEMFPHTASSGFLLEHANVIGMVRKPATKARLVVNVAGTGNWTDANRLVAPATSAQYAPTEAGSVSGSPSTLVVEALVAGTAGNLSPGSAIQWNPAPVGVTANNTVAPGGVVAENEESDEALAQRILAWWRDRPGGGNKADWVSWGLDTTGVEVAFVYRALHDDLGPDTPGSVTLCVMAPVPTSTSAAGEPLQSDTREVGVDALADLEAAIMGTGDYEADGGHAPADVDLRDVFVVTVTTQAQAIDVEVTPSGAEFEFPFTGTLTYTASTTTSITTAALPSGITAGMQVLIAVRDTEVRGGYAYRRATISGAGPYVWTWADALPFAPSTGTPAYPIPRNATELREKALAVFDALGPGAGADNEFSKRWPASTADYYPATLYRNSLVAALMGLPGVLGTQPVDGVEAVDVTLVGSGDPDKVVPAVRTLVTCGLLRILPV